MVVRHAPPVRLHLLERLLPQLPRADPPSVRDERGRPTAEVDCVEKVTVDRKEAHDLSIRRCTSGRFSEHPPTAVSVRGVTPDEFRPHGHALIDWIAEYLEGVEQLPGGEPGAARRRAGRSCPSTRPPSAEPFDAVLADLDRVVVPGLTHWQHP